MSGHAYVVIPAKAGRRLKRDTAKWTPLRHGPMRSLAATLAILAGVVLNGAALAAPQVLGLTASNAPIPFVCDDDGCIALAGTFCLQRERAIPTWGTSYEASHPGRLTLALRMRDGRTVRLGGGPWVRFSAYNGYSMVRMTVPRALLATQGAADIAVEIGAGVSLVPTPQAGDSNPQSADEIAFATGPLRLAAARYLDRPSTNIDAARLLAALAGAVPERHSARDMDLGLQQGAAAVDALADGGDPAALIVARQAHDRCRGQSQFRHCLIARHRELMERDNARYWDESAGY